MTTAPTFHEIVRRQRLHRLAAGKPETKADVQRERLALADELREAKISLALARADLRETEAHASALAAQGLELVAELERCGRRAARWCVACLAVGVAIGVAVSVIA
jgi:hypothetical protein